LRFLVLATAVSLVPALLVAQTATVQGTVTDAVTGAPIPETRVSVTGTALQAVTDVQGAYRITGVRAGPATLQVRRIGYRTVELRVVLVAGQTYAGDAQLQTSVVSLDEVVVTGTAGELKRRAQAATVSDIGVADIVPVAPVATVAQVLQSRVPGVSVVGAAGSAGTSSQIRVRGASSISLNNEPLLYVDGVRVSSGMSGNSPVNGQNYDRINEIDPEDIESIELVKGPAAATLYGADASTGVIQIITKRGRVGAGRFSQNLVFDYHSVDKNFEPVNNYGACSAALVAATSRNPLCRGQTAGTIVSDNPLLRENAFRTGHLIAAGWNGRGGGTNYGYFTSLNHEDQTGVFPNNAFQRSTGRVNFNWFPVPNLTLDAGVGVTRTRTDLPDNDNNIFGWLGNSHLGSPLTRTDSLVNDIPIGQNGWFGTQRDVAAMTAIETKRQTHRTVSTITANWTPTPWFSNRFTAGADWLRDEDKRFFPKNARGSYSINVGQITETRRGIERYTLDYLGNIRTDLTSSLVSNFSFGSQLIETREENVFASGEGLTVNSNNVVSAASLRSGGQNWELQRTIGIISQLQLGLNDRLYAQFGARWDNASSFGKAASWVFLPKVGGSWVVSEEPFWPLGFVNSFRLRTAWGQTGRIPDPGSSLTTLQSAPYLEGTIVSPGAVPQNPGNDSLRFERGEEVELGFDAGLFNDRLGLELTYFRKVSKDLILQQPLPPSLGFTQDPFVNIGSVLNSGFEMSMTALPVNTRSLTWDVRVGASTLHNEVTDMGAIAPFGNLNRVEEGMQVGAWITHRIRSIDEATGEVLVDSIPTFYGNVLPTLEGSISSNVTILRNLRIYASFDTKRGHKVRNFTDFFRETQLVRSDNRLDTLKLSRQERLRRYGNPTAGQLAFVTRPGCTSATLCGKTENDVQEEYIQDASFFRFREFSVTYTLPTGMARAFRAQAASITLGGQNLGLWTDYEGYDPEVVSNAGAAFNRDDFFTQPPVQRLTMRLNLTF
jgi:TonB-linked SusC/RagA family outer membrane protein